MKKTKIENLYVNAILLAGAGLFFLLCVGAGYLREYIWSLL